MNSVILLAELSEVEQRFTQDGSKQIQQAIASFQYGFDDKITTETITVTRWSDKPLASGLITGRLRIDKGNGYQIIVNDCWPMPLAEKPVNLVYLTGRSGRDPDVKYFESGSVKAGFGLAVDRNSKNETDPDWINLEFWGKQAQTVADYVRKGSLLEIVGELKIERWQDKDGNPASKPVVRCDRFGFLGSKKDNEAYQQEGRQPVAATPTAKVPTDFDYETIPF